MSTSTPTIILAETVLSGGIASFLRNTPYKVVASAASAIELAHVCSLPRLAIIGADLRNGSLDATAEDVRLLRSSFPDAKLVLILETDGTIDLRRVLALSPDGCIMDLSSGDALVRFLELISSMDQRIFAINKSIATTAINDAVTNKVESKSSDSNGLLSPRERQILISLAEGKSNKGIARHYNLSEATVKVHLKSVLRKLGKENRTQAAIWAIEHGLCKHVYDVGRNVQDATELSPCEPG